MTNRETISVSGNNEVAKPSYLFVVPSTTQMYSGTGTVIFDWIRFAKQYFEFSILIDTVNSENFKIAKQFGVTENIEILTSLGVHLNGAPDLRIIETCKILGTRKFDFVECVSWANASSNLEVLACIPPESRLIYTPHWQPLATLGSKFDFYQVQPVLEKMLERSDYVFADSEYEANILKSTSGRSDNIITLHLGIKKNEKKYSSEEGDNGYFLAVGDFLETRKRFDLTLKLYQHYLLLGGEADLYLAGNQSDSVKIPSKMRSKVRGVGYVTQNELIDLYSKALALISTSEYEAFGVPIAESLTLGTQVVINRLQVLESIFQDLPGVHFIDNNDLHKAAGTLINLKILDASIIADAALAKFSMEKTYGAKLQILIPKIYIK